MESIRAFLRKYDLWILRAGLAVSLVVPAITLFSPDGFLNDDVKLPIFREMWVEILILAALLLLICRFVKSAGKSLGAAFFVGAVFLYLHVMTLPMLASGLYLAEVLLAGRLIRKKALGKRREDPEADFVLGVSAFLVIVCAVSLAGLLGIRRLQVLAVIAFPVLLILQRKELCREGKRFLADLEAMPEQKEFRIRAGAAFIYLVLLIQAARVNISLDFDSLWYGLRSEYMLAFGNSIYENPGLVTMVSVYSKGFEVLTLPLCNLASHSYLLAVNIWLAAAGILETGKIAWYFAGRRPALGAMALTAAIPGLMNMAMSAKPDEITWLLQLIMIEKFLHYLERKKAAYLWQAGGTYLLSLTMKPTAVVFSTAVFGMMGLYLIFSRKLKLMTGLRNILFPVLPALALCGIWARTLVITGMPVTSVFTSVFRRIGFVTKYPFAVSALPQNWQDEPLIVTFFRRMYRILLAPKGHDSSHVILAWGTSLMFFLGLFCLLAWLQKDPSGEKKADREMAMNVIFWPFLAVNVVSLLMLYQIDGNYFMLLYTLVILLSVRMAGTLTPGKKKHLVRMLMPLAAFAFFILTLTNWLNGTGLTPIRLINKGRIPHTHEAHLHKINQGNAEIWEMLAADPDTKAIGFGEHLDVLEFPCRIQSYLDITAPWGNVDLVMTPEDFEGYMKWSGTEYVYVAAEYFAPEDRVWAKDLVDQMMLRGDFTDLFFENGNCLMRVLPADSEERPDPEQARRNLEAYHTFTAGFSH